MKRNILYIIALVSMIAVSACAPEAEVELSFDTDRIEIGINGNDKLFALAEANRDEICGDTLANSLSATLSENAKEWDINGEKVTLSVKVVK